MASVSRLSFNIRPFSTLSQAVARNMVLPTPPTTTRADVHMVAVAGGTGLSLNPRKKPAFT